MKGFQGKGPDESAFFQPGCTLSQEELLGEIVIELLREKGQVSRQSLCIKLATRLDNANDPLTEAHYGDLLKLIFTRKMGSSFP